MARKHTVVWRGTWTAVVKYGPTGNEAFGIYRWNLEKMKWVAMINHGFGFGTLRDARVSAEELNDEIDLMLLANRNPPPPMP